MDDLARLAGEEPASAAVLEHDVPRDEVDGDAVEEEREPSVLDDPFVHRFVQVSTHVRRYVSFYVGGIAWLLALVLIQPLGGGDPDAPTAVGTRRASSSLGAVASTTSPAASPALAAPSSSSFEVTAPAALDFSTRTFEEAEPSASLTTDDFSSPSETTDEFATSEEPSPSSFEEVVDEFSSFEDGPTPLSITRSGYASVTGGTPLEQQPPENGLPVSAAGGQVAKFSYIALTGAETTLRLKPVAATGGNVADDRAGIRACLITTPDWEPNRGVAMSSAPVYDATSCTTGARGTDGTWSFDVMDFGDVSTINGLAIVPVPDPALEFLVTFRPVAERAEVE